MNEMLYCNKCAQGNGLPIAEKKELGNCDMCRAQNEACSLIAHPVASLFIQGRVTFDKLKLKPFNLERALAGDPVVTRDGSKIIKIEHFPQSHYGCVVAQMVGATSPTLYFPCGKVSDSILQHDYDLFMAPKTRTVWVNLISDSNASARWFLSEEAADFDYGRFGSISFPRIGNRAFPIEIKE